MEKTKEEDTIQKKKDYTVIVLLIVGIIVIGFICAVIYVIRANNATNEMSFCQGYTTNECEQLVNDQKNENIIDNTISVSEKENDKDEGNKEENKKDQQNENNVIIKVEEIEKVNNIQENNNSDDNIINVEEVEKESGFKTGEWEYFVVDEDGRVYYDDEDLDESSNPVRATILNYIGNKKDVIIPSSLKAVPVTAITIRAFDDVKDKLEGITIPENVEYIEEYAFYECKKLKSIHFKGDACNIEDEAFAGTSKNLTIFANAWSSPLEYAVYNNMRYVVWNEEKMLDISDENKVQITIQYYQTEGEDAVPYIEMNTTEPITLLEGLHYTVEYEENTEKGEMTFVINGIGSCKGTVRKTLTNN